MDRLIECGELYEAIYKNIPNDVRPSFFDFCEDIIHFNELMQKARDEGSTS